ncbi:MAG: hypothetical protein NT116_03970 [Candidatus Parcubacteria bacterium]|nr:hypothetical protein [Candidatus Parcubacteria bacterium]
MAIKAEEGFSSGSTNIYMQYASVETEDWESLPDDSRIEVCTTDSSGQYGKPMPINKKSFKESFFPVANNIFQRKVRVKINKESGTVELVVLDQSGQETTKKFNVSLKNLSQNYQPIFGD